jgi:hypothetical protein
MNTSLLLLYILTFPLRKFDNSGKDEIAGFAVHLLQK